MFSLFSFVLAGLSLVSRWSLAGRSLFSLFSRSSLALLSLFSRSSLALLSRYFLSRCSLSLFSLSLFSRSRREGHTPLVVLQEGSPMEPMFFSYLVEDRANFAEGAVTYSEFLQTVQSGNGAMGGGGPGNMGGIPPSQRR
jgi:hypothetical protein